MMVIKAKDEHKKEYKLTLDSLEEKKLRGLLHADTGLYQSLFVYREVDSKVLQIFRTLQQAMHNAQKFKGVEVMVFTLNQATFKSNK